MRGCGVHEVTDLKKKKKQMHRLKMKKGSLVVYEGGSVVVLSLSSCIQKRFFSLKEKEVDGSAL